MKDKFAKLINVKSIMTIAITAVFCVLAIRGTLSPEQFTLIFTTIVAFYYR